MIPILFLKATAIEATASLLELVTTDGDFDHLQDTFLQLRKITPAFFQS
ncbi:hypothetical protein [Runella sp.]